MNDDHDRPIYVVESIEPGSDLDLFNRADPGCELCQDHPGRYAGAPCPCTLGASLDVDVERGQRSLCGTCTGSGRVVNPNASSRDNLQKCPACGGGGVR